MYFKDDKHIITGAGPVIWDGTTRPETKNNKDGSTSIVHSLRMAVAPGGVEIAELQAIADKELREGMWKGVLPSGGRMPLVELGAEDVDGSLAGFTAYNATTYSGCPQVYDAGGRILSPLEYGPMLYAGAKVKLVVHAFSYNNINKGVAFGLDGIQIVDATAPRLNVGGGIDVSAAFGGAPPAPSSAPPAPSSAPPAPSSVVPAHDFVAGPGVATPPPPPPPAGPTRQMTPAATTLGYTYEGLKAASWTDEQMITAGYLVDDIPY